MKSTLLFVAVITVSSLLGCSESTQPPMREVFVSLEVESAFQNDLVKLSVDGQTLLNSRISTNYVLSLAWSSGLQKISDAYHLLDFAVIEYGVREVYSIDVANDTSTITIRFDKSTKQIHFQQYKGILLRD
jgi:hypothetical protein